MFPMQTESADMIQALAPYSAQTRRFLDDLEGGRVPKLIPIVADEWGRRFADFSTSLHGACMRDFGARDLATQHFGMWALVDMVWTKRLANWIGCRTVLEIMAGNGWLSRALSLHGVRCFATDSREQNWPAPPVFPVHKVSAIKAVKRYRADILVISWPPYECDVIVEACKWRGSRPIIYIGEGDGGCNAGEEFWEHFDGDILEVDLPQWQFIHDYVWAGHWRGPHH